MTSESQDLKNLCRDLEDTLSAARQEVTRLYDPSKVGRPLPGWFQALHEAAGALSRAVWDTQTTPQASSEGAGQDPLRFLRS